MPAKPVAPPTMPLNTPTPPSAIGRAPFMAGRVGFSRLYRLKAIRKAPMPARMGAAGTSRSNSMPSGTPIWPPIRNGNRRRQSIARRSFHTA